MWKTFAEIPNFIHRVFLPREFSTYIVWFSTGFPQVFHRKWVVFHNLSLMEKTSISWIRLLGEQIFAAYLLKLLAPCPSRRVCQKLQKS